MKWAVLATWKMSENGNRIASQILAENRKASEAILHGISDVEDNPSFHSVGYGGRPDTNCRVILDGGYMDGDTLHFGAVGAIEGFRSPIHIAYSLRESDANNFLVGQGAEEYASKHHFEKRDNLTEEMIALYEQEKEKRKQLSAYDGHDTVCFLAKDSFNSICAGTSTSGLFMKEKGRLGDTPVVGNGFYADSKTGAAAATGMGEEIMKGCLSYAAVMYMKMGMPVQEAADKALLQLHQELIERNGYANPMSLIVLDKEGNFGVSTNIDFTFTYGSDEQSTENYIAKLQNGKTVITKLTE